MVTETGPRLDVLSLVRECLRLREIILALRRGDCWCEMAIGNPMVRTHSDACEGTGSAGASGVGRVQVGAGAGLERAAAGA